jgi:hypothetical protein
LSTQFSLDLLEGRALELLGRFHAADPGRALPAEAAITRSLVGQGATRLWRSGWLIAIDAEGSQESVVDLEDGHS